MATCHLSMFASNPHLELLLKTALLGPISLLWIVLVVRMVGLRSFSKMTAFDFISTVATGSLLATAAGSSDWVTFLQNSGAVLALLLLQALLAWARRNFAPFSRLLENEPKLLMRDGVFNEENLVKTRVSEEDVMAKLREANALDFSKVHAVVLEATGDISVLHGEDFDEKLLRGVNLES